MLQRASLNASAENSADLAIFAKGIGRGSDDEVPLGFLAPGLAVAVEIGLGQSIVVRCDADAAGSVAAAETNDGPLIIAGDELAAAGEVSWSFAAGEALSIAEPPPPESIFIDPDDL